MSLSRRQFIIGAGGVALAAGLAACDSGDPSSTGSTEQSEGVADALVDRIKVGCYVEETPTQPQPIPPLTLDYFEALLGKRFDIIHYFIGWGAPFSAALNANVPTHDLMISWDPPGSAISPIAKGTYDTYITDYAEAAKAYGHPVYLRFAAEMNGNWNSYSSAYPGGPPASEYKRAWQRMVYTFRSVQADNVKFIWCPTEVDTPHRPGNRLEDYWPGSEWVDILGFDAYNWSVGGTVQGGGGWRTFDQMCANGYSRVAALEDSMPIWLCQTGCTAAVHGDPSDVTKGGWFTDMFLSDLYPRLGAVVYFSSNDPSLERDWRINTSSEAVQGWRKGWLS
jgi:hypothetical protein